MDSPLGAIARPWFSYLAAAKDNVSVICPLLAVSQDMAATIRESLRGTLTLDVTDDIPVSWFERNGCLLVDVRSLEETYMAAAEYAAGPRIWHVLSHLTGTTKLVTHSIPRHLSVLEQLPNSVVELCVGKGPDPAYYFARGACDLRHLTQLTSLDFDVQCPWAGHADHQEFEGTRLPASLEKLTITTTGADLAGMLKELPKLRELSYINGTSTSDVELAEIFSSMTALTAVTVMYTKWQGGQYVGSASWGSDGGWGVAALLSALGTRLVELQANGDWNVERCTALADATNITNLDFDVIWDDDIKDLDALQRALLQLPKLKVLGMHLKRCNDTHSDRQLAAFAAAVKAAVPKADIMIEAVFTESDSDLDLPADSSEEGHDE